MPSSTGYSRNQYGITTPDSGTLPAVASAAALALPGTSMVYSITGTTGITSITGIPIGSLVTLLFAGIVTLTNGANLILKGGVNATTAANNAITFMFDGTHVVEVARNF